MAPSRMLTQRVTGLLVAVFVVGLNAACGFEAVVPDGVPRPVIDASAGDASNDAPVSPTCQSSCPQAGGTCSGETCRFSCSGANPCGAVTCPPGVACEVTCSGVGSCAGVRCSGPTCMVTCSANAQCGAVMCNAAACDINCVGDFACNGVTMNGAGTFRCGEDGACGSSVTCGAATCPNGGSCRSGTCTPAAPSCTCP